MADQILTPAKFAELHGKEMGMSVKMARKFFKLPGFPLIEGTGERLFAWESRILEWSKGGVPAVGGSNVIALQNINCCEGK